ncbi:hypothetical protein E4U30_002892 [Claviceps sp. LM220 group G6]|nr:hypothetical protein E4U30_002892 [Claviceps sp. LM220 group G6]
MEQSREDMKHAMLMMLTENKPFLAPIGDHPQKILDIGTGTGPWAKDRTMRIVGLYQKIAVEDGIPFLTGRPFQALEMSEAEAEVTIAMTRKGLDDPTVHRHFNYYFWYAQKPGSSKAEKGV